MTNEELSAMMLRLVASTTRIHARCDALETTVAMLGGQLGVAPLKMHEAIDRATEEHHQRRLVEIEKTSPALAAKLDIRPEVLPPGLFD